MKINLLIFMIFLANYAFAQQKSKETEILDLIEIAKELENSNKVKSDSVLEIAYSKAITIKNDELIGKILIERIFCHLNLNHIEKAKVLNTEFKEINKHLKKEEFQIKEKYFDGLIAMTSNDLLTAIKFFSEIKNYQEKNKNWKEFIKSSNQLSWCYYLNKQEEIGKKILKRAIDIAHNIKYNDIGGLYEKLGVMYANAESTMDSALIFFNKAEFYFIKDKDLIRQAYLNNNIGAAFFYKHEFDKAIYYLNKAYEGFKKAEVTSEYYFLFNSLGISYLNNKNIKQGEYYLLKAYEMVKKDSLPNDDESLMKEDEVIYFNLARLYEEKKDFKLAYQYLRNEREIRNAKNRVNYQNEIMAITKSNEMIIKENEINRLKLKQEQDKLKLLKWIFGLGILILSLSIFIFIFYRKQKANKLKLTLNAKAEERHRISRDLHDNIGSYAATILNNVENLNYETKDQMNQQLLAEINSNAKSMLSSIRDTLVVLKNKPIELSAIINQFITYTTDILHSYPKISMTITNNCKTDFSIDAVDGVNLQYILKEFFNNSLKHSNANQLTLNIDENDSFLTMEFNDNGIGFERNNIVVKNGLENIQYRAEQMKALVKLDSQPNKGTTWHLILNKNKLEK